MKALDPLSFLPLTPVAFHVLVTLEGGVQHGYAIKRAVEERTEVGVFAILGRRHDSQRAERGRGA